jgi:hypothetical protein
MSQVYPRPVGRVNKWQFVAKGLVQFVLPVPKRARHGNGSALSWVLISARLSVRHSPYLPQHFLYFLPLPQGQVSLRPGGRD